MREIRYVVIRLSLVLIAGGAGILHPVLAKADTTNYLVRGVLKEIKPADRQLVIAHEVILGFMDAMTMPFNVKDAAMLTNAAVGEKITFQLHVTDTESWIDHIERVSAATNPGMSTSTVQSGARADSEADIRPKSPLRTYKFTNELGRPVSLSDFQGQAIALTFFFTRCPIPEYCPRLSRNFEAVQRKLKDMKNAPTNWHLISVSFDSAHDSPEVLRAYGATYQYDPTHWSFLTGPADKVKELARLCDVKFDPADGSFNHNFRTLIIDPTNRLQMIFPTSGDLSDPIAAELLKAMGVTNRSEVRR